MDNVKRDILDFIDAFNDEVAMFKELEYEFFQEREEISKVLTKEHPMASMNNMNETYNKMLGLGFDLLIHGLNYKEYQNLMKKNLVKVDEEFLLQLRSLSMMTKEKVERYQFVKNNLKQALSRA